MKEIPVDKYSCLIILLILFVLPYSLRTFIHLSLSKSTFIAMIIYSLSILFACGFKLFVKSNLLFLKTISISLLLIALHSIICAIFFQTDLLRFSLSFIFLIFLLLVAFSIQRYLTFDLFHIRLIFYLLLFISLLTELKFFDYEKYKSLIFFSEPSHFSLIFMPFLFTLLVISNKKVKLFLLFISFLLGIHLQNLTFFAGLTLCSLITIPYNLLFFIFPTFTLIIFTITYEQYYFMYKPLVYYFDRLNFSFDSYNLSTMVYLSGWERGISDLFASLGFGIGFQQFGIAGPVSHLSEVTVKRFHLEGPLNQLDGGSLGAKFIGEFGIFGLFLLFFYLFYFIKFLKLLNISNYSSYKFSTKSIFFMSWFITFSLDIFVRGMGYFNPPYLIFIASVIYLFPNLRFNRDLMKQRCNLK